MALQFDDEELSMSLSSSVDKRTHKPGPPSKPTREESRRSDSTASELPSGGRAGQRIGQYAVKKTLGEGSFGKVKLAVHRVSGQEVALKIISRKKLISRDMAGRVEREIQYLQLLRHPHIIKLYTVITTPADIIMVLEYAGGELFEYLVKHGRMPEAKARRFFQQIVSAVEYCHRHKIVHRDLKPENLLLDNDLNVKIADFGLSNIMTDGNFLKTSCGSPNYAAPEVISGKLYAGPEVDVWSCGVILYVLLVGRLPFDDEFIPSLFKKINAGNYHMPNYLSSGARHIIHKMLRVNPVQRLTIQEIRQDPWFNENLEPYLKQPVEEFFDTGVDPNKAIDPRMLAPGKPPAVQEQIHESVVGKLGKTMGYGKDDVQDALKKDEPNAIKDAYLIVRENQVMKTNPNLTTSNNVQPFLATSPPPAWEMPPTPQLLASPLGEAAHNNVEALKTALHDQQRPTSANGQYLSTQVTSTELDQPVEVQRSGIGILTSSLPTVHAQIMEARKADRDKQLANRLKRQEAEQGEPLDSNESEYFSKLSLDTKQDTVDAMGMSHFARSSLHSRSTLRMNTIIANMSTTEPESQPAKAKSKATKWQFGIRSRNQPLDAMSCIYKALKAQGAKWECEPPMGTPKGDEHSGPYNVNILGATHIPEGGLSESPEKQKRHYTDQYDGVAGAERQSGSHESEPMELRTEQPASDNSDDDIPDINTFPRGYLPKDPWHIHVRWLKEGMYPPGTLHPHSAHSSRIDLTDDVTRRRGSIIGSMSSAAGSATSIGASLANSTTIVPGSPESACFVYMDVQLYQVEEGCFLVDFKCAGYEGVVEGINPFTKKTELIGNGLRVTDKDVMSPQPFLDLTNQLVIHLAKA